MVSSHHRVEKNTCINAPIEGHYSEKLSLIDVDGYHSSRSRQSWLMPFVFKRLKACTGFLKSEKLVSKVLSCNDDDDSLELFYFTGTRSDRPDSMKCWSYHKLSTSVADISGKGTIAGEGRDSEHSFAYFTETIQMVVSH
jgi:hypothetical protein